MAELMFREHSQTPDVAEHLRKQLTIELSGTVPPTHQKWAEAPPRK